MTPNALARLHAAAFPTARGWSETEFADLMAQPGSVLSTSGEAFVLGRVTLDEAEILTLACDPAFQRQGHGTRALARFETQVRTDGAERLFLEVAEDNLAAIALYFATGFAPIGRRPAYYRTVSGQRIDALLFCKALTQRDQADSTANDQPSGSPSIKIS